MNKKKTTNNFPKENILTIKNLTLNGKDFFKDYAYDDKYMRSKNKRLFTPQERQVINNGRSKEYLLKERIRKNCINKAKLGFDFRGKPMNIKEPSRFHRICNCGVRPSRGQNGATNKIMVGELDGRGFVSGLQTCGNAFVCPTCCGRYEEKKRSEIALILDNIDYKQKQNILITPTFPHSKNDSLEDHWKKISKAFNYFNSKNQAPTIKKNIGYVDFIKSFEVTYGNNNGWHPHFHTIWTIDRNADKAYTNKALKKQWEMACIHAGLLSKDATKKELADFRLHSLDIMFNAKTSQYLAKAGNSSQWGIDREMSKGSKKTISKGLTPFQLADIGRFDLFFEYMKASDRKHKIEFGPLWKAKLEILKTQEEDNTFKDLDPKEIEIMKLARSPIIISVIEREDWYNIVRFSYQARLLTNVENADTFEAKKLAVDKIVELSRRNVERFKNQDKELEYDPDPLIQSLWQNQQMKGLSNEEIREISKRLNSGELKIEEDKPNKEKLSFEFNNIEYKDTKLEYSHKDLFNELSELI